MFRAIQHCLCFKNLHHLRQPVGWKRPQLWFPQCSYKYGSLPNTPIQRWQSIVEANNAPEHGSSIYCHFQSPIRMCSSLGKSVSGSRDLERITRLKLPSSSSLASLSLSLHLRILGLLEKLDEKHFTQANCAPHVERRTTPTWMVGKHIAPRLRHNERITYCAQIKCV